MSESHAMNQHIRNVVMCSAAVAAMMLGGCAGEQPVARLNSASSPVPDQAGDVPLVDQVRSALTQNNHAAAISLAELAVRSQPEAVEARVLLARAYFQAGRFVAAVNAYDDVTAAGHADNHVMPIILAQLASGRVAQALAHLDNAPATTSQSDRGLAYALAGQTQQAIAVLTAAVRNGEATARTRQNLALTLALDGQWAAARVTALQDLTPDQLDMRLIEWTRIKDQPDAAGRTAMLLGIAPAANDLGRPLHLAWQSAGQRDGQESSQQASLADSHPAMPEATPPVSAPEIMADAAPVAADPVVKTAVHTAPDVTLSGTQTVSATTERGWVIQLGAFSERDNVDRAWHAVRSDYRKMAGYVPTTDNFALKSGKILHRLSVGGFDNVRAARATCRALQKAGHECFVRPATKLDHVRMASSAGQGRRI